MENVLFIPNRMIFIITFIFTLCNGCSEKSEHVIYINSDHSNSYDHILELDGTYDLILLDTHSDAEYNDRSKVYDYNWIAPLLGERINSVYWTPPVMVNSDKRVELSMDVHSKMELTSLAERYKINDFIELQEMEFSNNLIVSVDLDYFINFDDQKSKKILEEFFIFLNGLRVKLFTVAISSFYHYRTQGDSKLLKIFLETAEQYDYKITFEPYQFPIMESRTPRQFIIETIHPALKEYLVNNRQNIITTVKYEKYQKLLDIWSRQIKLLERYIDRAHESIIREFHNQNYKELTFIKIGEREQGVFVRLLKGSKQRGCFTFYRKVDDMEYAVDVAAINAAFYDDRTSPLEVNELKEDMAIEVTLVDEFLELENPLDFILGHHTILMVNGAHRALIQPSLVFENNWSKEEYLEAIAVKAGLPKDIWMDADTRIFKADSIWLKRSI